MKTLPITILLLAASCGGRGTDAEVSSTAQSQQRPQRNWRADLDVIAGTWNFESGEGAAANSERETCRWIPDGSFIVCKVEGSKGFSMIGWEEHNQRYVHYGINSLGVVSVLVGEFDGSTWRFSAEGERVTMVRESPDLFSFKAELLGADGKWSLVVDGKYVRTEQ